jgi:hypothetical protein
METSGNIYVFQFFYCSNRNSLSLSVCVCLKGFNFDFWFFRLSLTRISGSWFNGERGGKLKPYTYSIALGPEAHHLVYGLVVLLNQRSRIVLVKEN